MRNRLLIAAVFLGVSAGSASATCTSPAVMHDFPGTAFNMSLATNAGDGNCISNVGLIGTLPAYAAIPAFKIDQTTDGTTNAVRLLAETTKLIGVVKVGDGTNSAAIKAASTAPSATDPAAVVALSPNGNQALAATQGTSADAPATVPTTTATASEIALLKAIANQAALALPAQTGFGVNIGAAQQIDAGSNAALIDPCQSGAKVYTPVNVVTATNVIIAGVSAKKKYICSILLYPGGTVNFAVYQATTSTSCATAAADIFGGHTTGTGFIATAAAGFVAGNGASSIAATNAVNTDICITTSASVQVSGVVVTVDR